MANFIPPANGASLVTNENMGLCLYMRVQCGQHEYLGMRKPIAGRHQV